MTHPIQYQIGLLQNLSLNKYINYEVNFYWNFGVDKTFDNQFNTDIKWDFPLLNGYKSFFLKNYSLKKSTNFWGCINPGAINKVLFKKYDGIIIFGWYQLSNWLVIFTSIVTNTPIFLFSEAPYIHEKSKKGFIKHIRSLVLKIFFKFIKGFFYIGEENKKFYIKYGVDQDRLFFAPYSVDNDKFNIKYDLPYEKDSSQLIILFVGKLIEKKNPLDLIKAFHLLQRNNNNLTAELWFVGNGDQLELLKNYVSNNNVNNVIFWGFKNQNELSDFYNKADVFVLPSGFGETWGLVINEAMCHGLPIIASDRVGCVSDLVSDSNGFIYPCSDIEKLYECIYKLLINEKLRINCGNNSKSIINKYSHKIAAENISMGIDKLIKNE